MYLQARERSGAAELQRALDRSVAKQRQADEQLKAKEEQLKAKANEITAANARVSAAQAEEGRAAAEGAQSRETIAALSKSLVERDGKVSALEARLDEVQRGGEVAKAQMAELQQGRHAADAELRAGGDNARLLGQQLEGRAQEVSALTASNRLLEMRLATAEHELKTAQKRQSNLDAELREARGAAEGHEARWREAQQLRLVLETTAARREQERQAANARLASVQQALQELQPRLTETLIRPLEEAQRHLAAQGGDAGT